MPARFFCLLLMSFSQWSIAENAPNYFWLTYYPGASWNAAIGYETQPGLKTHHEYLQKLHIDDQLVMGGPITHNGLNKKSKKRLSAMLLRTSSMEEAERLASQDPGVISHVIRVEVVAWDVTMSSMRFVKRRPPLVIEDPDQTFRLKRMDLDSRLNLED